MMHILKKIYSSVWEKIILQTMPLWNNITYNNERISWLGGKKINHLKLEHLMIMHLVPLPTVSDVIYHKLIQLQCFIYK